ISATTPASFGSERREYRIGASKIIRHLRGSPVPAGRAGMVMRRVAGGNRLVAKARRIPGLASFRPQSK
ncbi:MAG TPA: hypothetical protein VFJ18_08070, partial [Pararhizobium sp.]|nr:hypothetical protein [Pararhizobium sp.]